MRVRVLGPLHVEDGGRPITVGGVRQRAVLADLVLHANEVVPSEQLLVELWGEDSPPGAANALQAAISRLRRVLPAGRLITTAPGYMLRVFPAELDVAQFEQLTFEGRDALAGGAAAEAVQLLDQAMTLWRARRWPISATSPSHRPRSPGWRSFSWPAWKNGTRRSWHWAWRARSRLNWAGWWLIIPSGSVFAASSCW